MKHDRNGYAPSILQNELDRCFFCGSSCEKLDRHEVFHGSNRRKSKALGLWVMLCHNRCHLNGVHASAQTDLSLKKYAQKAAMNHYGWSTDEFTKKIGRNYL